jgi:class 3 adenylate cyclase
MERDRSDNLLLNILPAEIAAELKANGEATARNFEEVSILFTDFKDFTQLSEKLRANELVSELNHCFKAFDQICENHGIEKLKPWAIVIWQRVDCLYLVLTLQKILYSPLWTGLIL